MKEIEYHYHRIDINELDQCPKTVLEQKETERTVCQFFRSTRL